MYLVRAVHQLNLSFPRGIWAECLPSSCHIHTPLHPVVFTDKAGVVIEAEKDTAKLFVAVCSDKGLCGGVHSAVNKRVKALVAELPAGTECVQLTVLPLSCACAACWNYIFSVPLSYETCPLRPHGRDCSRCCSVTL